MKLLGTEDEPKSYGNGACINKDWQDYLTEILSAAQFRSGTILHAVFENHSEIVRDRVWNQWNLIFQCVVAYLFGQD